MKLNFMPVLSRGFTSAKFAVTAALAATTIAMVPLAVKAQTPVSVSSVFPLLSGIQLTAQQQIDLADLGASTVAQFDKIISPDQKAQFRKALADNKEFGEALAAMKITDDQQKQMQGVFSSAQQKLISTLTPAQRQKVLDNMRAMMQLPANP
jgi:hypothetical protein